MRKHIVILSLALATLTVGAGQAGAQTGTPVYTYFYYDQYGNRVGTMRGRCYYDGTVRYTLTGSQSPYREEIFMYYCGENGPEPE
jgi:hypothetical protein